MGLNERGMVEGKTLELMILDCGFHGVRVGLT